MFTNYTSKTLNPYTNVTIWTIYSCLCGKDTKSVFLYSIIKMYLLQHSQ